MRMTKWWSAALLALVLGACATGPDYRALVASGDRSEADRGIDQRRDPVNLLSFYGLRAGTLRAIDFTQFEGLICMPSFHVASGLMVTWAFRGRPIVWALALLNALLILATLMSGVHWAVDLVAALPLFALSVVAYQWWGAPLVRVR